MNSFEENPMLNRSGTHASHADDISWQDYEELVKDIYQALGRANGVTIECWGNSCKVEGPPGVFHQIDVLTSHSDGLHRYRTAISCKYWNKNVGIPIVRDFALIIQEARLSKGVIVSKIGFTKPAKDLAKAKNIGLVELRKPLDRDWDGYLREIHINLIIDQTQIDDIQLKLIRPKPVPGKEALQERPFRRDMRVEQIVFEIPGEEAKTLQELTDEEQRKDPNEEEYNRRFPEGSVVTFPKDPEHPAHGCSIASVSFKVRYNPPLKQEIVVRADDHIYMIMESLFDGPRFNITNDGEIKEITPGEDEGESAHNAPAP